LETQSSLLLESIFLPKHPDMKLPFIFAKRFVAGETFESTIPKIEALNQKGIKVTL